MKYKTIDVLYQYDGWLTSPIVDEEMAFPFLTMGHVDFCEALGFPAYQATKCLRQVVPDALKDENELDKVIRKKYFDYSFFDRELEKLENLMKGPGILKGGGVFGPLTIASDILGAERTLRLSIKDPSFVIKLVDYVTEFIVELAKAEVSAGADFFWIAEPFPSVLAPKHFTSFSGTFLKRIYDSVDVPGWLHVCGPTLKHTKYLEETGAQVISIDYVTDIAKCIRMVSEDTVIMGNISPSTLFIETEETVDREITEVLDACRHYKNFIMSTGCAYMEGTPKERIKKLYKFTNAYDCHSNEEFRQIRSLINMMLEQRSPDITGEPISNYISSNSVKAEIIQIAAEEYSKVLESKREGGYL